MYEKKYVFMLKWFSKRRYQDYEIQPDEIFLDDINISRLNEQQFEGVMEKPISSTVIVTLGIIIIIIFVFFSGRLFILQVIQGDSFFTRSENNRLKSIPIFSKRGIIYDRNGIEIVWNVKDNSSKNSFPIRTYTNESGHAHMLGYVRYPEIDSNGNYWREEIIGIAGLEKKYNDYLAGLNGAQLIEVDSQGQLLSNNIIKIPNDGENLVTTIDTYVQHALYTAIEDQAHKGNFQGGAGILMDVHTGELISFTSYPEFDSQVLSDAIDTNRIRTFMIDSKKPFLNRLTRGLYSPGSTIKPFLGIAALHEGIITKNTKILSTGKIEIPNKFNPNNPSIFRDWRREGHGLTDIKHALADSVNTFFYALGGGFRNQKGLGIKNIERYLKLFGIAQKTGIDLGEESLGIIPNPEWKKKIFSDETWRLGDTYITSIGQFGFQVTPIQMVRATAALANKGMLLLPRLVKGEVQGSLIRESISDEHYNLITSGLREAVTKGTAQIVNVPFVDIAAKTGTAQVGSGNEFFNSWIIGFFPYEKPRYSFVIVMERAPRDSKSSAARAMRTFIDTVQEEYPEFFKILQ